MAYHTTLATPAQVSNSNSTPEVIVNIVFGISATTISIATIWQGRCLWRRLMRRCHENDDGEKRPLTRDGLGYLM